MIGLTIYFEGEALMFEWLENMVGAQALPARASIREENAPNRKSRKQYVLDSALDEDNEAAGRPCYMPWPTT